MISSPAVSTLTFAVAYQDEQTERTVEGEITKLSLAIEGAETVEEMIVLKSEVGKGYP